MCGGRGGRDHGNDEFLDVPRGHGRGEQTAVRCVVMSQIRYSQALSVGPSGGGAEKFVAGRRAGSLSGGVVGAGAGRQGRRGVLVG